LNDRAAQKIGELREKVLGTVLAVGGGRRMPPRTAFVKQAEFQSHWWRAALCSVAQPDLNKLASRKST
jgi:hypothetical protein